jgi:hypothetical protein
MTGSMQKRATAIKGTPADTFGPKKAPRFPY